MTGGSRRHWLRSAGAAMLLLGCADAGLDHLGPEAPGAETTPGPPGSFQTAWVFSSGGPRGFVHVGVLKGLAELGLRADLVVGASAGSLVAVLHGSGHSAAEIEALALDLSPLSITRLAFGAPERFSGAALADLVRDRVRAKGLEPLLEQLPVPVVCVVHDLDEDRVIGFRRGDAGLAVQASSAIEGQFAPVRIRGRRYADADRHMPLPVRLARALGARRVLAVDASAHEERAPPGAEGYRDGDLRKRALTRPDAAEADVLLHPDFGYWVSLSRDFRERSIAAGYGDTMAAAETLRRLHAA